MYIIINSKNMIAEICKHLCYVRTQTNGVTILSSKEMADAIYSNDTDSFYGVRRVGAMDAYKFLEVGDVPEGVTAGYTYKDGEYIPPSESPDSDVWDEIAAAYTEGVNSIDE